MIVNKYSGNGGGGGGSYVLPTATANRLGGIKVGSGLTITNDGVLSASGGTAGESNYVIVDAISAITNPVEGMMAIERTKSVSKNITRVYVSDKEHFQLNGDGQPEDYFGFVKRESSGDDRAVYLVGNQFHWEWDNSGDWASRDFEGLSFKYKTVNADPALDSEFWLDFGDNAHTDEGDGGFYFVLHNSCVSTAITSITEYVYSQPQIYQNGAWTPIEKVYDYNDIQGFTTTSQTAELVAEIRAMVASGKYPSVIDRGNHVMLPCTGNHGSYVDFWADRGFASFQLSLTDTDFGDDGFNEVGVRYEVEGFPQHYQTNINITSTGDFVNPDQLGKFSEEIHTDEIVFVWNSDVEGDPAWGQAPLKYLYRQTEGYQPEEGEPEDRLFYYWGVEIPINGVMYQGDWHCMEGDWGNYEILNWTVATYPAFQLSTFDTGNLDETDIAVIETMFEFYDNFGFDKVNPDRLLYCGELNRFFNFEGWIDDVDGISFFNSEKRVEIVREYNEQDDEYTYSINVSKIRNKTGYFDFYVDITDPRNPDLMDNPGIGYYWESSDYIAFVRSAAGEEGYGLNDKSVRIHFMVSDEQGGYEEARFPVQYGKVEDVIVYAQGTSATFNVRFFISHTIIQAEELFPEKYYNAEYVIRVSCYIQQDNGVVEVSQENGTLIAQNAWISLGGATEYLSGLSIYSLEKFAMSLAEGTNANLPLFHYDGEYSACKRGDVFNVDNSLSDLGYIDFSGHYHYVNPTRYRLALSNNVWTLSSVNV